jgi:hypothetical protein
MSINDKDLIANFLDHQGYEGKVEMWNLARVIPAKAGIQIIKDNWIPAFAGMTSPSPQAPR